MNILKLICGLLLLDFLLKKSKSPDSQAHSEAGEYNLLRTSEKNQRYKSQEKERKTNGGNTRAPGISPVKKRKIQHNSRCEKLQ